MESLSLLTRLSILKIYSHKHGTKVPKKKRSTSLWTFLMPRNYSSILSTSRSTNNNCTITATNLSRVLSLKLMDGDSDPPKMDSSY